MESESKGEAAPEIQGERVTLHGAMIALVVQPCFALFLSAVGLYLFLHGSRVLAGACCLGAMAFAVSLPAFWRQYRLVKAGAIVIAQSKVSPHVHPAASILLTSLMTLMVLIMGAGTLYILPLAPFSFAVKIIFAGFNLLLWLITGFLWYRIVTERRKTPIAEPVYEQGEGVWPPAPQRPKNE